MKRVVFYVQNEWAFGRIYNELSKNLYRYDIDCYLLDWAKKYTREEIEELDSVTDLWSTTPQGYNVLHNNFGVPPSRVSIVSHHRVDLDNLVSIFGIDYADSFYSFGVVSSFLSQVSVQLGIKRNTVVCNPGISVHSFNSQPAHYIRKIGFGGIYSDKPLENDNTFKNPKRGWLVKEIAERTNCELKVANQYHNSYVTMQGFYASVDCLVQTSVEEGAGLPTLEAAAAGKLVLTTPVGIYEDMIRERGGISLPFDETELVETAVKIINDYNQNSEELHQKCKEIQKHAQFYDWKYTIKDWLKLF